jgi:hypothetical protein
MYVETRRMINDSLILEKKNQFPRLPGNDSSRKPTELTRDTVMITFQAIKTLILTDSP